MKQILTSLTIIIMSQIVQAQDWVDTREYPFEHHYVQLSNGKMHYVDEGKGDVILFVHGTPTWSFLYRDFIKEFSKNYRCIAVDHIGFGLSEKPKGFTPRPQDHAKNLSEFISKLNLRNITLVVHDFGGPIGLASAIENPEKINRIILFNSWLWETKSNPSTQKVDQLVNSWLGKFLYLNLNLSPKVLLKKGFADKKNLPKNIHKQYIKPFPNKEERKPLLSLAKSLVGSSDWYQHQWENLSKIEQVPWLIMWGSRDEFLSEDYLQRWTKRLPMAEVKKFDCGHFVQEEKTTESIMAVHNFLKRKD